MDSLPPRQSSNPSATSPSSGSAGAMASTAHGGDGTATMQRVVTTTTTSPLVGLDFETLQSRGIGTASPPSILTTSTVTRSVPTGSVMTASIPSSSFELAGGDPLFVGNRGSGANFLATGQKKTTSHPISIAQTGANIDSSATNATTSRFSNLSISSPLPSSSSRVMSNHSSSSWAPNQAMPDLSRHVLLPSAMTTTSTALQSSGSVRTASSVVEGALTMPKVLPPAPYLLTPQLVTIACPLEALETHVRASLVAGGVDYEYSRSKWKAKCYQYKEGGSVYFVLRAYTSQSATYLLELQRLRGSQTMFRGIYDRVVQELRTRGVITTVDPSILSRLTTASLLPAEMRSNGTESGSSSPATPSSTSSPTSSNGGDDSSGNISPRVNGQRVVVVDAKGATTTTLIRPPPSLSDASLDPDDDPVLIRLTAASEFARGGGGGGGNTATTPQQQHPSMTQENIAATINALAALSSMLTSEFDDVACPAAHSISAMTASKRVRASIGQAAFAGLESWRASSSSLLQQQQSRTSSTGANTFPMSVASRQSSTSGVSSLPTAAAATTSLEGSVSTSATPSPTTSTVPVAQMLDKLLARACMPCYHPGMPPSTPRSSIECRTACAIALANLATDESAGRTLGALHAAPRLLYAAFVLPHCAASAAFRREVLRTVSGVLRADPDARRAAVPQMCLESAKRMPGVHDAAVGDRELDKWCEDIANVLMNEIATVSASSHGK